MTGPGTHPARVLIVDDEPAIRRVLRIALQAQGHEVEDAATGSEGIASFLTARADLVLLDLELPDQDGHAVLARLREISSVPVIVLSVRSGQAEKVRALDGGAHDFVTKPFGTDELLARVRGLLRRGGSVDDARAFHASGLRIDFERREVTLDGRPVSLTRKEFAMLQMLARAGGAVVPQRVLLREIWGPEHVEDSHYLRIVAANLRQKLSESASAPRHVVTVPGVGYRLGGEPEAEGRRGDDGPYGVKRRDR